MKLRSRINLPSRSAGSASFLRAPHASLHLSYLSLIFSSPPSLSLLSPSLFPMIPFSRFVSIQPVSSRSSPVLFLYLLASSPTFLFSRRPWGNDIFSSTLVPPRFPYSITPSARKMSHRHSAVVVAGSLCLLFPFSLPPPALYATPVPLPRFVWALRFSRVPGKLRRDFRLLSACFFSVPSAPGPRPLFYICMRIYTYTSGIYTSLYMCIYVYTYMYTYIFPPSCRLPRLTCKCNH